MKLLGSLVAAFAAAAAAVLVSAVPAQAATGEIVVFTTELEEVTTYQDPESGSCRHLPLTAHVVINQTDSDVFIHANAFCFGPGVLVAPDRGWHAPPSGMFSLSVA
ncbi:hypothetical protein [Nocardiopsis sp. NRRL B-16309]|uniref:hypothetical protein n=1 Tax=Nocardiopsis sp. NRRL B-16309 TaxID=1519494 RepID=UPI0006AE90A6|nr:hypothetical protein [Nocardiopsis sp. NRRL B-16309]KOX12398.1 hypothetical protein ADL05_21000 [Nocardiopsis sp. NRRL B-16309]